MNIEQINLWFARQGKSIVRYRWGVMAIFLLLLGVGVIGIKRLNITSSWDAYFLEDDPMLLKTEEFKSVFGNDNYVAVLTETDNTFTQTNLSLIRSLSNELLDSISYADKITSLTNIEFMVGTQEGMRIEQIVPDSIPDDPAALEAIRSKVLSKPHVAKRLVSTDGRLTWILLKLRTFPPDSIWKTEKQTPSPEYITGSELERIISKEKYRPIRPRGAGLPYITVKKMEWMNREMPRVMGLAVLLSLLVLLFSTRSLRGIAVPILTALSSIAIVYGLLGHLRFNVDSGMLLVPMLLAFAVAIAYNIHIHSYFKRRFLIHGQRKLAVQETVGEMGWPVLFSALTTFAALLSFLAIPMQPMRFMGIATSLCVLCAFFITITLMPALLSFGRNATPNLRVRESGGRWLDRQLALFGEGVLRYSTPILLITALLMGGFIYGFARIETAFDVERTMGRTIPYVRDALEISESELGSMYTYDMMIDLPEEGMAKEPEQLIRLDSLVMHAESFAHTKRTTSILNVIKDLNQTLHDGNSSYYAVPTTPEGVAQLLLLYENAGGSEAEYWMDYEYRRLRLMTEINGFNSGETERNMQILTTKAQELFPGSTVTVVGSIPQFTVMMQYVARGQIVSFAISLLIIGILMMIVFGSVRIGLIGLIPNITPALVVGGLMGWLNYPLDMMTATIMPMILGLAVDDTIHFINHGRLEFSRQRNYQAAIVRSFRVVGTPLLLTSIVIASNFALYTTSDSLTIIHMGLLAVSGVLSALLADLCVTPLLFKKFEIFGKETPLQPANRIDSPYPEK